MSMTSDREVRLEDGTWGGEGGGEEVHIEKGGLMEEAKDNDVGVVGESEC